MTLEHQVEEGFWKYFAGWRELDTLREEALQDAFAGRATHELPEDVASSIARTANSEYVNIDLSGDSGTAPKPIPTDLTPEVRDRLGKEADRAVEEYILKENGKEYFLAGFETEKREGKRHNGHLVVRLSETPEGLLDYLWLATKTMDDAGELIQRVKTLNIESSMCKVENLLETYGEKFKESFREFLEKDAPHLLKVLQQPATIEEPIPLYQNGYKCSILEESTRKPYLLSWKWIDSVREQTLDGLFERIEKGRSGKQEGFFEQATTKELRHMLKSEYIALKLGKKEYVDGMGHGLDKSVYSPSDEEKETLVAAAKESATGRFVTQDGKRFFIKSLKTTGECQDGYLIVEAPETDKGEEDAQKLYLSLIGETLDDAGYAINELQKKTDGHLVAARMLLRSEQQRQDITDFLNGFEKKLGVAREPEFGLNGEDMEILNRPYRPKVSLTKIAETKETIKLLEELGEREKYITDETVYLMAPGGLEGRSINAMKFANNLNDLCEETYEHDSRQFLGRFSLALAGYITEKFKNEKGYTIGDWTDHGQQFLGKLLTKKRARGSPEEKEKAEKLLHLWDASDATVLNDILFAANDSHKKEKSESNTFGQLPNDYEAIHLAAHFKTIAESEDEEAIKETYAEAQEKGIFKSYGENFRQTNTLRYITEFQKKAEQLSRPNL